MLNCQYDTYLRENYQLIAERAEAAKTEAAVESGWLVSRQDQARYRIEGGIPRFVPASGYADSFGYQWNLFKRTQFDSFTGKPLSAGRLWENTRWQRADLTGRRLLECGSGAGRFTEVFKKIEELDVVTFDYSNAVDANHESNRQHNVFFMQADIFEIPLPKHSFDFVFCYGVLQHTPDPERAFYAILEQLKPGGRFSVDIYRKMYVPVPWAFPKYFWRPLTKRMNHRALMTILKTYIPLWFPFDTVIKKIPYIGQTIAGCLPIPCWNYMFLKLGYRRSIQWAIMDTFDALSPEYDIPATRRQVERWCLKANLAEYEVFYGSNGIVANGIKA